MGPLRSQLVLVLCFVFNIAFIRTQNIISAPQRQITVANSGFSQNQSPNPQQMNTVLTVAAANGVVPEILNTVPSPRQDSRPTINVIPASVFPGPLQQSALNQKLQTSSNFQNTPFFRLNSNPSQNTVPTRINLSQQQILNSNVNANRAPANTIAKINPIVIDKNFGIPMNLELSLPPVSIGVEVPEVNLPAPPTPPPSQPAPEVPFPAPTYIPINVRPNRGGCSNSRLKSWIPLVFLSMLNNGGRCGSCGGFGGGCGGLGGGRGGGCSSCNAVPVPYPIPVPVVSPIVVRCDSKDSKDSKESEESAEESFEYYYQ